MQKALGIEGLPTTLTFHRQSDFGQRRRRCVLAVLLVMLGWARDLHIDASRYVLRPVFRLVKLFWSSKFKREVGK